MKLIRVARSVLLVAAFGLTLNLFGCKGQKAEAQGSKAKGAAPAAQSVKAMERPELSIEHCSG